MGFYSKTDEYAYGSSRETSYPRSATVVSGLRFYSPGLGRFLSRDPIAERGGMNLYAFVQNAPQLWVDPWGFAEEGGSSDIIGEILQRLGEYIPGIVFAMKRKPEGYSYEVTCTDAACAPALVGVQRAKVYWDVTVDMWMAGRDSPGFDIPPEWQPILRVILPPYVPPETVGGRWPLWHSTFQAYIVDRFVLWYECCCGGTTGWQRQSVNKKDPFEVMHTIRIATLEFFERINAVLVWREQIATRSCKKSCESEPLPPREIPVPDPDETWKYLQ